MRNASLERSVYTGVMTIKGKLCADAFIHAGGDFLLVDTEPELRETLATRLERYIIADDVRIEDVTDAFALLHLIDFAADAGTPKLPELRAALAALGPELWTVESARYGRPGTDVFYAPALDAKSPPLPAREASRNSMPTRPKPGGSSPGCRVGRAELDENTMPAEAGVEERAVSYTKGCYIGQEIVSRVKSVGHVNRQLRGPAGAGFLAAFRGDDAAAGLCRRRGRPAGEGSRPDHQRRPGGRARRGALHRARIRAARAGKLPARSWTPPRCPPLPMPSPP